LAAAWRVGLKPGTPGVVDLYTDPRLMKEFADEITEAVVLDASIVQKS
jgi:hypothetical protein